MNLEGGKNGKKALVLLSGGQDSTTCLYDALRYFDEVHAIGFHYKQNHAVELEYAKRTCEKNSVPFTVINMTEPFAQIGGTALIGGGDVNEKNSKGLPASFVPNRNQLFLTVAHGVAQKIGAHALITGVCETDYSGYPDCRDQFIRSLESTTNLGSMESIKIITPLMWLDKAQTFELADTQGRLKEIIEDTMTCYNGVEELNDWGRGCGECPACTVRMRGYKMFLNG